MKLMIYLKVSDIDKSLHFYSKLGFISHADDIDGLGDRYVRLSHPGNENGIVHISLNKDGQGSNRNGVNSHTAFTVITTYNEFALWERRINKFQIEIHSYQSDPWGKWLFLKDPDEYLVSISTNDMY